MFDFNRNHYFALGVFLVMLGAQFRLIDTVTLNDTTSQFIEKRIKKTEVAATNIFNIFPTERPQAFRSFRPPRFIGWALLSVGGVLVLHSLAMKKPGGG